MREEIIIAGFGGQGVLMSGKLLCTAAMREGKEVSHIPSYGAEMRGGTANCSVIISDDEIASPVVEKPTTVIALNEPSLRKFEPRLQSGGLLIYNSSLIKEKPKRKDITIIGIPANKLSEENGSLRAANMAVIGLLIKLKPVVASLESAKGALDEVISRRNIKFNSLNRIIMDLGYTFA